MHKLIDFWNSDLGRRVVKWGTSSLGLAISSGLIPLDTPLFGHFSVGTILMFLGYNTPTTIPQSVLNRLR